LPGVERRLEHRALGPAVGVRLQIEQLGLQQDLVEQLLHVLARLGGDRRGERRTAELLEHTPCASKSCFTFCTLAAGRSILLIATTSGTPAFLACEIASIVCGMIASVGSDHQDDEVRDLARRARAWP